ncbi:MAG: winged helix-turn-helix domain-containing protein [Acidilobaceae archaeon]|nr:winged helix-turn-helix domain-containing protein [Acidilobaceae archaeon]MCX8165964.1 winged helix-turn-helix domain-containing protein [Acidilobaceae archaeon]MDW7974607.1 winged helix-turn-helix domain-containing protein [Sulfolobales archaeon]
MAGKIAILAIVVATALAAVAEEVVLVPLDTCSHEALLYAKERGWLDYPIAMPADLKQLSSRTKLALISAYPPEPQLKQAVLEVARDTVLYASSDVLDLHSERLLRSDLLQRFCWEGDEGSLRLALEPLMKREEQALMSMVLLSAAAALGIAALAHREISARLAETGAIIAVFFMRLRKRGVLTREDIESHPVRIAILEALKASPQSFSDLQKRTGVGRAVLEWHLGTLKAYGMVEEKKVGRSRVFFLASTE